MRLRFTFALVLATVVLFSLSVPLSATQQVTFTFPGNLGQISANYAVAFNTTCRNGQNQIAYYNHYVYSGALYTQSQVGISNSFSGITYFNHYSSTYQSSAGTGSCPASGPGPNLTYNGSNYTVALVPDAGSINGSASVSGYMNPKYAVVGITYAPPGPSSKVDYTKSTLISNSSDISSSFTKAVSVSVSVSFGGGIEGFAEGKITNTNTTSWSDESNTGTSLTISKQTTLGLTVPGPCCAYSGVDHDYDIIWVWLNPVSNFTISSADTVSTQVQWNGHGYSTLDPANGMDVIGVYVGYLNGDFGGLPSSLQNAFARSWAGVEQWPSGQGPGLTGPPTTAGTDLNTIAQTDPYWQCTYQSPIGSNSCPGPDPNRFTITGNADALYEQAPPGGQPFSETLQYTTTVSQSVSTGNTQTFGVESVYSKTGSLFGSALSGTLTIDSSLKWTHVTNHKFETTNTSTAQLSITGPPCSGSPCNPVYPPAHAFSLPTTCPGNCSALSLPQAYGQAWEFQVYEDNVFGGFLLVPDPNAYAFDYNKQAYPLLTAKRRDARIGSLLRSGR